jgi:uncharacterized protein with von Willebrand factor type A (vWA) domain
MTNGEELEVTEVQSEVFMDKHDISYDDLNEELKELYDALDESLTEYENLDDEVNETEARDLLIVIEAKDNGLLSKLEPFQKELKEKRDQAIASATPPTNNEGGNDGANGKPKENDDEMGDGGQAKSNNRPSWRFW